jgi:hypothetical protein
MTRKDLMKLIEDEVTKVASEPLREPERILPAVKPVPIYNPALKGESEVDEYLFRAGMKDE